MNKQPISYMQTDPRWKDELYCIKGKRNTIGASGCGPTCAAMLISTLTGKEYTPVEACKWSVEHGHRSATQGTYYSYFKPQFAEFGIRCEMLSWTNVYGAPEHSVHERAFAMLKQGYYLIAVMGPGTWTSSGHFVVVWWEDGWVRINDPASAKSVRVKGHLKTFKSQVKYYWAIDARKYNSEEDDDMDDAKFKEYWQRLRKDLQDNDCSDYSDEARKWIVDDAKLVKGNGSFAADGKPNMMWEDLLTREQEAVLLYRYNAYVEEKLDTLVEERLSAILRAKGLS